MWSRIDDEQWLETREVYRDLLRKYEAQKTTPFADRGYVTTHRGEGIVEEEFPPYFPEQHYREAIRSLEERLNSIPVQDRDEPVPLPDGGSEQYYWKGSDGVLVHTESDPCLADPFVPTVDEAERLLRNMAEEHGWDQYSDMALYKVKQNGHYRVMESTEVKTDQAGLTEF